MQKIPETTSLSLSGFRNYWRVPPEAPGPENCSGDITLIPCTSRAKWLLYGKVLSPAANYFLAHTSAMPHEVCEPSQAPWVPYEWRRAEEMLALAGGVAQSFTTTVVMTTNDGD